ncbi:MAG: DUF456 domain-containing protein [Bacteroidales bacterium]|nr:DUF456 domain-containing protein [Bacteroidales bacterium]
MGIIAIILGLVGLVGCILPVIPGPPISWAGMLLQYLWGKDDPFTTRVLIIWLVVTIVVTVIDYVVPSYFTRVTGGSKAAGRGSLVGLFVGLIFFPPWGMIGGAFLGALLAEILINGKELRTSLKPALGSFAGFLCGTFIKLVASGMMLFYIIKAAF